MLRFSLASLSVALLIASTARAQMRGGGGACASGPIGAGAASSLARTATGGGTNAPGFGMYPAATYSGLGDSANAAIMGAGTSNNVSIAAAGSGMGGFGVTDGSNPSAQVMNADRASFGGLGAINGMNGGPFPFAWDESYLLSDPFAASLAAAERGSTYTTPRTRAKPTKSKVKRRVTRAKGASR
jgi:hypothetical protein